MASRAPRGRRPAGGPDTREEILSAARELFAEVGFDRTTIRAVAGKARVDPSLVHHYFGDKDALLQAAIEFPVDPVQVFAGMTREPGRMGEELVRRLLTVYETVPGALDRMVALIRTGLSHELAASALRQLFSSTITHALAALSLEDEAELRAALVGSQVVGLFMARYVVRIPALADADIDRVAAAVGPNVERYLRGALDGT